MAIIEKINSPKDLKNLSIDQLNQLAEEIRLIITNTVFTNGGHLSSNLGVVELTIAIEYVFDHTTPTIVAIPFAILDSKIKCGTI